MNLISEIMKSEKGIGAFEFEQEIGQLCKLRSLSRTQAKSLTGRMYKRYIQTRLKDGEAGLLIGFARLCYAIDNAKKKAIGQNGPTSMMNTIIHCLVTDISARFEWSERQLTQVQQIEGLLMQVPGTVWLVPKFALLVMAVRTRLAIDAFALELSFRPGFNQQIAAVHAQLTDIRQMTQNLLAVMQEIRKYGVKPCYFGADTEFRMGGADSWMIEDSGDFLTPVGAINPVLYEQTKTAFALISLTEGAAITTFKVTHSRLQIGAGRDKGVALNRSLRDVPVVTSFWFNMDGSLSADPGNDPYLKLEPLLRGLQLDGLYEVLQLQTVLHLFDLVVPTYRLRNPQLPHIPPLFGPDGPDDDESNAGRLRKRLHPNLILPRIRLLDQMGDVYSELDREIDEAETVTRQRVQPLANHPVIHHIRRLPPGRKASAEAHVRARECGFELQDGETFVRDHKRGEGDAVGPHHAVFRAAR